MKGDNTFVQNQYGQDQTPLNTHQQGSYGQPAPAQQGYGAVGNMGQPQPSYGHQQQHHGQHQSQAGQPIYVVDQQRQQSDVFTDIVLYIVALFLPPASVVVKRGCGGQFWINVLLTILGFFPGTIHAFYIIAVTPGNYQKPPRR